MLKRAVVVDGVRTAVGRSHPQRGCFRDVRSDDLAAACVRALLERTGVAAGEVEEVVLGCAKQTREQGFNVARMVGLLAGLPCEAAGTTVNRLCGSGLQALNQAVHAIMAGAEDVHVVGGLEHMHHLPLGEGRDPNLRLFHRTSPAAFHMGLTAEYLARRHEITREDQDRFALRSHQRAAAAHAAGAFRREIIPVWGRDEAGRRCRIDADQCVRPDTSLPALANLRPAFLPDGTVTAGNSAPLNDGAAALLVMSEDKAHALGLQPLARVRATAVAGVEPCLMGTGPVPATHKALQRAGLTLADIDLVELNEAFAAQALACIRMLGLDEERVNVRGGAIAIGHPLGASGARIATTLIHALRDRNATFGLATMCIGGGQGIATIFERVAD
jgi:acetyl-CoA acyltransferase